MKPSEGVSEVFTLGGPQGGVPGIHLCDLDTLPGLIQLGCQPTVNPHGNTQFVGCWFTNSFDDRFENGS